MSSKLKKLIASYEAERASLTTEMEECVAEMDYSRAHLFLKALRKVDQQLQTLFNIRDKWHDEKEHLARWIKSLEERVKEEEGSTLRHLIEEVAKKKEQLAELPSASTQDVVVEHNVRATLTSLLVGEITSCTLVFRESQQLYCHIRLVRKTLILTVPEIHRHRARYILQKSHIREFKRLGFRLYDSKDKLMLFAPYSTLKEVDAVHLILARITFEIFYFQQLAGETFIKYYA
jgi:hypothetical protein